MFSISIEKRKNATYLKQLNWKLTLYENGNKIFIHLAKTKKELKSYKKRLFVESNENIKNKVVKEMESGCK